MIRLRLWFTVGFSSFTSLLFSDPCLTPFSHYFLRVSAFLSRTLASESCPSSGEQHGLGSCGHGLDRDQFPEPTPITPHLDCSFSPSVFSPSPLAAAAPATPPDHLCLLVLL